MKMKKARNYPDARDRVGQKTTPNKPGPGQSGYIQDRYTSPKCDERGKDY